MEILALDGHIYVQLSFLKRYGVKEGSVCNQLGRNRRELTSYYDHFTDSQDKRIRWIRYSTISPDMFQKHKLPSEQQLHQIIETEKQDKLDRLIALKFDHADREGFKPCIKYYQGYFYEPDVIHQYARNHSVFQQIQQLRGVSVNINKIFAHYQRLDDLVFETVSLKAFYHKLKQFEQCGHEAFIHKSLGKTKNNRKLTEAHLNKIKELFKDKAQWSYRVIQEKLNIWAILNGYSEVSVSTIKKVLADKYIQNQCKPSRNGKEWSKLHIDSFRLREEPESNGELWQMDGSRFQFAYLTEEGRVEFIILFAVMDVHSRKIVGYATDKTENHLVVMAALRMAAETTGYIPSEILRDKGSCFKHVKYKKLEEHIAALGTNIRSHLPNSPNDKGHIESYFSVFQTIVCKGKFGYVGEGIKSKRESGRPSREVILQALKKDNLRSRKELVELLVELIDEYNSMSANPSKKSPSIRFEIAERCEYSYKLSENEIALMFWNRVQEYHVRQSMVLLSEGSFKNKQFQYLIDDDELRLRLNGTIAIVCYQKDDREKIKLFDQNERFITDLQYSKPVKIVYRQKENKPSVSFEGSAPPKPVANSRKVQQLPDKHQLYQTPGTLEVLLIKTKGND